MVFVLLVFIYEHELTYTALYTILLLPIFSFALTLVSKRNFTIQQNLQKTTIIKGEVTDYFFSIQNNSFLPCTSVQVYFNSGGPAIETNFSNKVFSIMPFKSHDITFNITAKYRGEYNIGVEKIIVYDFLGLFSFKQLHKNKTQITIRPTLKDINIIPLSTTNSGIETAKNYKNEEDYSVISDLRKYQPSDGYKKIHWKASAKRNELMSKNFQDIQKNSVTVVLDNSNIQSANNYAKIKLEDTIMEACVSILNYAHQNMFSLSVRHINNNQEDIIGDFDHLYNATSKVAFDATLPFDDYLADFAKTQADTDNIVILTQDITEKITATCQELAAFGSNVVLFYFKEEDATKVIDLDETLGISYIEFSTIVI